MSLPNTNPNIIASIYQSYLSSFSKDLFRSLDNERLGMFAKSFEFVKFHNDEVHGVKESTSSALKSFTGSSKTNPSNKNQQTAYFLRINQFSDMLQSEVDSIFIKDAPTFDSIANYRQILEKNDVTSEVNEYFQYNLRRRNMIATEMYDMLSKNHSTSKNHTRTGSGAGINSSPSTPVSLSTATLNWASANNPKQRSILPSGIRNQGLCGACWAFVATSSVEASISKNFDTSVSSLESSIKTGLTRDQDLSELLDASESQLELKQSSTMTTIKSKDNSISSDSINTNANEGISEAIKTDKASKNSKEIFGTNSNVLTISLSVQELIDCDTEYDRGCSGGNPVNAFRYIMTHGLTTADRYPLDPQKFSNIGSSSINNICRSTESDPVRGSIKGFISITPFRQELMLQSLITQGPISVGICGTDMTFLYYGGGIYNPDTCCSTLNHALLLIGYGTDSATGLDYWIAQNSWGPLWGEGGYMRILRRTSPDAHPGVCGLALTPSIALGGYFMKGGNISDKNTHTISTTDEPFISHQKLVEYIEHIQFWLRNNWKVLLFGIASICFLISSVGFIYLCILDYVAYHVKRRRRAKGSKLTRLQVGDTTSTDKNISITVNGTNGSDANSSAETVAILSKPPRSRKNSIRASPMHLAYPQTSLKVETAKAAAAAKVSSKQSSKISSPLLPHDNKNNIDTYTNAYSGIASRDTSGISNMNNYNALDDSDLPRTGSTSPFTRGPQFGSNSQHTDMDIRAGTKESYQQM